MSMIFRHTAAYTSSPKNEMEVIFSENQYWPKKHTLNITYSKATEEEK